MEEGTIIIKCLKCQSSLLPQNYLYFLVAGATGYHCIVKQEVKEKVLETKTICKVGSPASNNDDSTKICCNKCGHLLGIHIYFKLFFSFFYA